MAATDQTYRNQKALDIVFAGSSVALLASLIWMFVQDYNREWKAEQRAFRDVEAAMFTRQALADLPDLGKYKEAVKKAREARDQKAIDEYDVEINQLKPKKERGEARVGDIKSKVSSFNSFYDIAMDHQAKEEAKEYKAKVEEYEGQLAEAQAKLEDTLAKMKEVQRKRDKLDRPLTEALTKLKLATDDMVRRARAAVKSQWGFGDWFRSLPIIDGFASPTKIHQFTLNELTIDYNFKGVTRFDRCETCHRAIDRPAFTKANLRKLREGDSELEGKLASTKKALGELRSSFAGTADAASIPNPDNLNLTPLSASTLTDQRINEFAAHPRLDLFVGSNSKHPAEKFGCTICHAGQGSATDFYWASHTPNSLQQAEEWKKTHDWGSVHFWDFPMYAKRFAESACLKCHHQVTDLITSYNRHEAPRLLRGYNLIRENGCFGCHEIQGTKDGKDIGPDLRLEPYPALELLPAADRARLLADKDNPPGTMRKVGPSLFRVSEKTNEAWVRKWIKSPRSFRPDTKMPHFYGLSNNNEEALKGTGQEEFPDAEVASIAHFLKIESKRYVDNIRTVRNEDDDLAKTRQKYEQIIRKVTAQLADKEEIARLGHEHKEDLLKEIDKAKINLAALDANPPIADTPKAPYKGSDALYQGRKLFTERGCLACHNHHGTTEPLDGDKKGGSLPAVHSEAHFGPTLTQIRDKVVANPKDPKDLARARNWLIHWISNPQLHSPRSRMPITHLEEQEAAAVAEWLLSQDPAKLLGPEWKTTWDNVKVKQPEMKTLEDLVKVYLVRIVSRSEMDQFFTKGLPAERVNELPVDEKTLAQSLAKAKGDKERRDHTMWYVGRKAVGRLGCFGCHDIPGFENAKPIGTGLNEWGKKDPGRLAFEDILNYLDKHHTRVDDWKDRNKVAEQVKEGKAENKTPYDGFFWEALQHHTRQGYLYQKIKEPRSYDYRRLKAWDDRSRMPQFKFAHPHRRSQETKSQYDKRKAWQKATGQEPGARRPKETEDEFRARAAQEEADAREAVMTFVLGLTGEAIPTPYVNNPMPDRLAEIKGRQVLDKFNCAGCHYVRPGAFEFRVTRESQKQLGNWRRVANGSLEGDYNFLNHYNWQGRPPTSSDVLVAHGILPELSVSGKVPLVKLRLSEALAYRDEKGKMQNIRAGKTLVGIPAADLIYPAPAEIATPEVFHEAMSEEGPLGGRFTELMVKYLIDWGEMQKEKGKENPYPAPYGDNDLARASVPPPLFNQGERTQPDWLFRFLRDPQRVRKLTKLRMPRFNLSEDDARKLVNYFAAVDRMNNPNIGLTYPYDTLAQRGPLTDSFWRDRSAEYVKRLKETNDPTNPKRKVYDAVLAELTPLWEKLVEEGKKNASKAEENLTKAQQRVKDLEADEKKANDAKKKQELADTLKKAKEVKDFWVNESQRLKKLTEKTTVAALRDQWQETEAYAHAGYRMLTKGICSSCHEVGPIHPGNPLQGPSLNISHERLRPGWLKRWIANPQRYLPYGSSMPQNFPSDKRQLQEFIVGPPLQQVIDLRDTLINFPQVREQPINRLWLLSAGTAEKTAEKTGKKSGGKKK